MGHFHSKPKKVTVDDKDKALLDLKINRDRLSRYEHEAAIALDRELQIAKELVLEGHRDRARLVLSKRKYQEKLLTNARNGIMTIEKLILDVEFAKYYELSYVDAMRQGTELLNKLNNDLKNKNVEKLMDDTEEAQQIQREISETVSRSLSTEDTDAVDLELEQLMAVVNTDNYDIPTVVQEDAVDEISEDVREAVPV